METSEKLEGFGAARVVDGTSTGMNFGFIGAARNRDAKCCYRRGAGPTAVASRLRAENNTSRNLSSSNYKSLYV